MPKQGGRKAGDDATNADVLSGNARIKQPKDDERVSGKARVVTTNKNYASGGAVRGSGCASRGTKFGGFR